MLAVKSCRRHFVRIVISLSKSNGYAGAPIAMHTFLCSRSLLCSGAMPCKEKPFMATSLTVSTLKFVVLPRFHRLSLRKCAAEM